MATRAMTLGMVMLSICLVPPAARAATVFGAAQGEPELLYEVDTVAGTATVVCNAGGLAPDNGNSPNGLAYDAVNERLYFSINEDTGDGGASALYFCDLATGAVTSAGAMAGQAASATFDQATGQYLYIRNRQDNLAAVSLKADGTIDNEQVIAPSFSGGAVVFRGGDIAIDCDRVVYGSSLGTGGGSKVFFSVDLANGNAYALIHADPNGNNDDTGFATAKQLAFADDGTLLAHRAGSYWDVDLADGLQSNEVAVGPGMADLASARVCRCETDLIAGGGSAASAETVGQVAVQRNGDLWDITYSTTGPWEITETHLEVACSVDDIPQTSRGNPKVGQFCYSEYPEPGTQEVVFEDVSPGECLNGDCDCVVVAAHAVVRNTDDCVQFMDDLGNTIEECRTETAWGAGNDFDGRSWATWFQCGNCD